MMLRLSFLLVFFLSQVPCCTLLAQNEDIYPTEEFYEELADSIDTAFADSLPYPERAVVKLDSLCANEMFDVSQLGLMVYDLDADSVLYARGERQLLRPASTMKLLTAITAIDVLGANHLYRTAVFSLGERDSVSFHGDLYVKGTMDPTLESYDVDCLVEGIARLETDTIYGNIVADSSFMDSPLYGEGWCWDDDNPVLAPLVYHRKGSVSGILRQKLDELGIVVIGTDSIGAVPEEAELLAERFSSMETVLAKMMKHSDNLYAESVFYNIGAFSRQPSTAGEARLLETETMRKAGLDPDSYRISDGSGLSLYNYLSAECEVFLLRYAYRNNRIFDVLYELLPIAGVDGTLKKRMKEEPAFGNVRAKTGSLTGVYSLAGYCTSPEGHMLAFSIINQGVLHGQAAHAFQDKVCRCLCE